MTYYEAGELYAKRRSGSEEVKLAGNTYLVKEGNDFRITFHATTIITIHLDGTYTLNTSGHRTVTTKQRLNKYGPANIFQRKGQWLLVPTTSDWSDELPFFDGLKVDSHGVPTDPIFRDMRADDRPHGEQVARLKELAGVTHD